jgi:aspartyl-tRNA(Asn)/glutamyl-tRNA(Gln) amidotransferase subunit B
VLVAEVALADYYEAAAKNAPNPKAISNWVMTELLARLAAAKQSIDQCRIAPAQLVELVALIDAGKISGKIAKDVFATMCVTRERATVIVERDGLQQISDVAVLRPLAEKIIADNPRQVGGYRGGNDKLLGFFVGQLMKATDGKANPQLASDLMKQLLAAS